MKTAYLSGPMRSIAYFNAPLFYKVAGELRRDGWIVWSPAEHDTETFDPMKCPGGLESEAPGFNLVKALTWDFGKILEVEIVVFLPGWERSKGCLWEMTVAYATEKSLWLYEGYITGDSAYSGVHLTRIVPPAIVTDPTRCQRIDASEENS